MAYFVKISVINCKIGMDLLRYYSGVIELPSTYRTALLLRYEHSSISKVR